MLYPKKIKKYQYSGKLVEDPTMMVTPQTQAQVDASKAKDVASSTSIAKGVSTGLAIATPLINNQLEKMPENNYGYGIKTQNVNGATGQGALTGMSTGAQIGSSFGPWGTAIGAGAGLIGGGIYGNTMAYKNNKAASDKADGIRNDITKQNIFSANFQAKAQRDQAKQQLNLIPSNYQMRSAKKGGEIPKFKFQAGGKLTQHAVIPSGPLHSEENNMGTKGLPVVESETQEKKAEVEREEIIFTKPQSEVLEQYHKELSSNPSPEGYEKFGMIVSKFISGAKDMNDEEI